MRRSAVRAAILALAALAAPSTAAAQMPGVPVLQNAFASPGVAAALNVGSADDARTYALAGSWTPGSARFVVSGGAGLLTPTEGDGDNAVAWGARVAAPIPRPAAGNLGLALFVGVGGADVDAGAMTQLPVGVAVGWRWALGATRAMSIYGAPFYQWSWMKVEDESMRAGHVRVSAGLDFALAPSWGVTAGLEAGQTAEETEPGPTGLGFGIGLSYTFGRGQ